MESDFRLVAATNRDLDEMVQLGLFRSDLLYRLQGITINLPPLRERLDDIEMLAAVRLRESETCGKEFSREFLATLRDYDWPGNVRELNHAVDCALAAAHDSPVVYARHLPVQIRIKAAQANLGKGPAELSSSAPGFPTLKEFRNRTDREYVEKLLEHAGGNVKKAAEAAAISRGYLYEMMKKYGLRR
jgi:two-component system NtrC family response regulator